MAVLALAASTLAVTGCGDPDSWPIGSAVVAPDAWTPTLAQPLGDDDEAASEGAVAIEQATRVQLDDGDFIRLELSPDALAADAAPVHAFLLVDDELLWEDWLEASTDHTALIPVDFDLPSGAPLVVQFEDAPTAWHVDNVVHVPAP